MTRERDREYRFLCQSNFNNFISDKLQLARFKIIIFFELTWNVNLALYSDVIILMPFIYAGIV